MAVIPEAVTKRIDDHKAAPTPATSQALRALLKSEGLFADILHDYGSKAPNLHRWQNVLFTIALIGAFCWAALVTGAFPNFSATVLALMGVSSGAYVGFKAANR